MRSFVCLTIIQLFFSSQLIGQVPNTEEQSGKAARRPSFSQKDVFELEYANDPQISPDGKTVVYCRISFDIMTDKTVSRLWTTKTDGTEHRPLTSTELNASSPRWSPDGKKIVYVAHDGNQSQIYQPMENTGIISP